MQAKIILDATEVAPAPPLITGRACRCVCSAALTGIVSTYGEKDETDDGMCLERGCFSSSDASQAVVSAYKPSPILEVYECHTPAMPCVLMPACRARSRPAVPICAEAVVYY